MLIHALAGYLYLIKLSFREEEIIIIGDSNIGGNLALVVDRGDGGKLPKIQTALVSLSPWTDTNEQFLTTLVENPIKP